MGTSKHVSLSHKLYSAKFEVPGPNQEDHGEYKRKRSPKFLNKGKALCFF